MRPEPAVRDDQRCGRHGCKKPLPPIAVKHGDPFCSNVCCSAYHHVRSAFPVGEVTFGRYGKRREGGARKDEAA